MENQFISENESTFSEVPLKKERPTFLGTPPSIVEPWEKFKEPALALFKLFKNERFAYVIFEKETWRLIGRVIFLFLKLLAILILRTAIEILDPTLLYLQLFLVYIKEVFFGHTTVFSSWFYLFEGLQWQATPFFNSVEEQIESRQIPDKIKFRRVRLWETGILSPRRLYMKVKRKGFVIYLCGAPYGNAYFFSWYVAKTRSMLFTLYYKLLAKVPIIGPTLVKRIDMKTFYQFDTANAFSMSIHNSIQEVIDMISEEQGLRSLSENEKEPIVNDPFKR